MADLLNEFVSAEDSLNMPDSFWYVWSIFKGHVIDSINNQGWKHDKDRIIESFLFARVPWQDEAKTWHTFSPERRYSLARMLAAQSSTQRSSITRFLQPLVGEISGKLCGIVVSIPHNRAIHI